MLARVGTFTASRAADLMARDTGRASRANLLTLFAVERITGQPVETYQNAAMQRGGIYGSRSERRLPAFTLAWPWSSPDSCSRDDLPNTGCSPDGLIGDVGAVEFKMPSQHAENTLRH